MKRVVIVLLLTFSFCGALFSQTEWQGRVARGSPQDFPSEGYYAASNSFARNSIVSVTNPATGKSVRVVISRGLSDNSLFMTLSADAARTLGLDGSFPATMKAQPVIIPGVSDQSIGSELPFTRDPDINPSASAGDPNAFVFNSQSAAQDIRPVKNEGQAAVSNTKPVDQPVPTSKPNNLTQASTTKVNPAADVDLSGSTLIGNNPDKLPTDLNNQTARTAGSEPPLVATAVDYSTKATIIQPAGTTQVEPADGGETGTTPALTGHAAALGATSPAPAKTALPSNTADLGATGPATIQARINPASLPGVTGSPAGNTVNAAVSANPSAAGTSDSAIARGIQSSMRNLKDDQPAATASPAAVATNPPVVTARGGAMAAGVDKIGQQKLGQMPAGVKSPPITVAIPETTGVGTGIKTLGSADRNWPNTGDVARPDHLFSSVSAQTANPAGQNPDISLPMARDASTVASETANPELKNSLLERQLAAINERNNLRELFGSPRQESDSALLPSANPGKSGAITPGLPLANVRNPGQTDPSLAGRVGPDGKPISNGLPIANKTDDGKADPSLARLDGRTSPAGDSRLPLATAADGGKADPSLPGQAGRNGVPGDSRLPVANALDGGKADPSLPGSAGRNGVLGDSRLPLANAIDGGKADPSLPGQAGRNGVPGDANLPLANSTDGGRADPTLSGLRSGIAAGVAGRLPEASVKGDQRPESSNPYLDGETSLDGFNTSLPVAQLVPGEIPQATLRGAGPGIALVPDKSDLPMVALQMDSKIQPGFSGLAPTQQSIASAQLPSPTSAGNILPEDPVNALRPAQTVVSLEPADYRPPQIPSPATDRILVNAPPNSGFDSKLVEARVKAGLGPDASLGSQAAGVSGPYDGTLAAARNPALPEGALNVHAPQSLGVGDATLATAATPAGVNSDAMLQAMRPQDNLGSVSLVSPHDRTMPELLAAGTAPAVVAGADPKLTQARTPSGITKDPGLAGLASPNGLDANGLAVTNPRSPNAENLLPGQKVAVGADGKPLVVNPALPGLPNQGKNAAGTEPVKNTTVTNITPTGNKPPVTDTGAGLPDDQWAQKNLPMVKNLQKEKYYLQVGAFANPRSAKSAIGDIAPGYQIAVLPEKATNKAVYKVFIGPLNEDEKGMMLYMFRAKGYRDAFIKKAQQ